MPKIDTYLQLILILNTQMSRPIKILVVSNYNDPISSRPEAEIFLTLSQNSDFQVEVITDEQSDYAKRFKESGILVTHHIFTKKFDKESIQLIRSRLVEGKHDIAIFYNSKASTNGIRAAKDLPVKVVLYRGYAGNISWMDPTLYFKYFHPRVDQIICNAEAAKTLFEKQLGFKKGKAITIHKGHDPKWYGNVTKKDLSEFGIPSNAFVAACVANARKFKGIKYLLEAFKYIDPQLPIFLLLIGKGQDTKEHLKIISKLPAEHRIKLIGFRKDSLSIVKASDTFVLASLGQETITKSVIEAMSLGTVPIITQIDGNKELVIDGESGLLVPTKDPKAIARSIIKLYENPALKSKLQHGAQKHIATALSHEKTVLEYGNFFRSLTLNN